MQQETLPNTSGADKRILIVDDEELAVQTLEKVLTLNGFRDVRSITEPRQVLSVFQEYQPDIIILDLRMPGLDGFAVIRQLAVRVPEGEFLPILVTSGDLAPEAKQRALALGAADFLEKPYGQAEVCLRVRNLLRTRELTIRVEEKVLARTIHLKLSEVEFAMRLAAAAELRDYHDAAHVQRVGRLSALIAEHLGLDPDRVELIQHAAPLHDIGKIGIPDSILLKPDALTLEEWDIMKTHTTLGAQLLSGSRSPILQLGEEIALYHHECWNGTGYTPGLAGEDIPLVARIVAVADAFDALTHQRPYKDAWAVTDAVRWMQDMRAIRYDPAVLDALVEIVSRKQPGDLEVAGDTWQSMLPNPQLFQAGPAS